MKKILAIGDLHGSNVWKTFADIPMLLKAEPDAAGFGPFDPEFTYVFLGDYTDSYTLGNNAIKKNLLEIIEFKKLYPNNVILLWGNHDVSYALDTPWGQTKHYCTGNRPEAHFDLYEIFNKNYDLFQLAFQFKDYLFTHAGVHIGWYKFRFEPQFNQLMKDVENYDIKYNPITIADRLNIAFRHRLECLFDVDFHRWGDKQVGGPLWLDRTLANKPIPNFNQVVGHNRVKRIYTFKQPKNNASITFIDILTRKNEFFTAEFSE